MIYYFNIKSLFLKREYLFFYVDVVMFSWVRNLFFPSLVKKK